MYLIAMVIHKLPSTAILQQITLTGKAFFNIFFLYFIFISNVLTCFGIMAIKYELA